MARSTSPLFDLPNGVVFEPRSQWSARTVGSNGFTSASAPVVRFEFNREHFRNAGRWPIEIRRVAVSAINYFFASDVDPTFPTSRDVTTSIVARSTFRIGLPGRQRYMPTDFNLSSLTLMPMSEPQARVQPSNGLFGIARLKPDQDRPLIIPRTGTIDMSTTSILNAEVDNGGGGATALIPNLESVRTTNAWAEAGGLFAGSGRSVQYDTPVIGYNSINLFGGSGQDSSNNDDLPFGSGGGTTPLLEADNNTFWAKSTVFSGKAWNEQNGTRNGSTRVLSNTVAFDQMAYDDDVSSSFSGRIAAISQRVGSRVRAINCGSQANWWRPGCPLALSHDAMTPALVYQLPQPIVLQPGDTFNVTATIPGPNYGAQFGFPNQGDSIATYQIGLSFNGYAIISG